MAINEKATTVVDVNGKNASDMLIKLEKEARALRDSLKEATKAGDLNAWKDANSALSKVNKDINQLKKSTFDTTQVLKNLNGTSLNDLTRAKKILVKELDNMTRGTQDYINKSKDLQQVTGQISKVKGEMFGATKATGLWGNSFSNIKGVIGGVIGTLGIGAGLAGALTLVKGVINSTEGGADKFKETMSGLKEVLGVMGRALATMDFSNLIKGMKDAYNEGVRYEKGLDLVGDLKRSNEIQMKIIEGEITTQKTIAKTKSNELKVRQAAIDEIIRLEETKLEKTKVFTNLQIENQLKNAEFQTKTDRELITELITNRDKYIDKLEEGAALEKSILEKSTTQTTDQFGGYHDVTNTKLQAELTAQLSEEQRKLIALNELDKKLVGEKRDLIAAAFKENIDADNALLSSEEGLARLRNTLHSELINNNNEESESNNKRLEGLQKYHEGLQELEAAYWSKVSANALTEKQTLNEQLDAMDQAQIDKITADADSEFEKSIENLKTRAQILNEYNLVSLEEKEIAEIEFLEEARLNKIITQEEFEAAKFAVEEKYRTMKLTNEKKTADEEKRIQQEKYQAMVQYAQTMGGAIMGITGAMSGYYEAQKQRELKAAGDNVKKKEKIEKEYAKKQKRIAYIQAIINTALAVTSALTTQPFMPLGLVMAVLAGVAGAIEIATISSQEFAQGKYPVIGKQTNKRYNANVSNGNTGVYSEPTYTPGFGLYGEAGPEMVIDSPTFRNIQMNTPELISNIMAHRVPQYAAGDYSSAGNNGNLDMGQVLKVMEQTNAINARLSQQLESPIQAIVPIGDRQIRDIRTQIQKTDTIEAGATRS